MIILDTHVISESLRPRCSDAVTAWLDAQAAESLYLTTLSRTFKDDQIFLLIPL
jgi:predicted nucleic acid-binding protein